MQRHSLKALTQQGEPRTRPLAPYRGRREAELLPALPPAALREQSDFKGGTGSQKPNVS
jgi:hypothetical protein